MSPVSGQDMCARRKPWLKTQVLFNQKHGGQGGVAQWAQSAERASLTSQGGEFRSHVRGVDKKCKSSKTPGKMRDSLLLNVFSLSRFPSFCAGSPGSPFCHLIDEGHIPPSCRGLPREAALCCFQNLVELGSLRRKQCESFGGVAFEGRAGNTRGSGRGSGGDVCPTSDRPQGAHVHPLACALSMGTFQDACLPGLKQAGALAPVPPAPRGP